MLEPRVLKCLLGVEPLFGVDDEELSNEIHYLLGARLKFDMIKVVFCASNLRENFLSAAALEWEVTAHEHVEEDSERPYVALVVIVSIEHFRSHVVRRSSNGLHLLVLLLPLGKSEVDNFNFIISRDHDVLWLDIPMHNIDRMHVIQGSKQFLHIMRSHIFSEDLIFLLRNLLEELSSCDVLHNEVDVFFIDVSLVVSDDVWVV